MADSDPHRRTGFGYDAHRYIGTGPVLLAGVAVPYDRGVAATSDGDVPAHAVADAVLGVGALGDIGQHFRSDDPESQNIDSMTLLARCVEMLRDAGWTPEHADLTVVAESLRVAPHRDSMRTNLSAVLGIGTDAVSVKATSTDGLGWIGADDGLAAFAVVTGVSTKR